MGLERAIQAMTKTVRYGLRDLSRRLGTPLVRPWWVIVDITDRCFFRCPTCAKWHYPPQKEELSTEEWRRILDRLGSWLGHFHLSFTGGEPLLRQDVPELIGWARRNGATTNLMTNGYLIDETMVERLRDAGLDSVTVSLNGIKGETHDRSRGYPGSFERAIRALRLLKGNGRMQVNISAILSGQNAEESVSLVEWARSEGIDGVGIQPLLPTFAFQAHDRIIPGHSPAWQEIGFTSDDRIAIDGAIDRLIGMKKRGYPITSSLRLLAGAKAYFQQRNGEMLPNCVAGFDNLLIDPYGEVRICNLMEPLGNAVKIDPRDIWRSPLARSQRQDATRCRKSCRLLVCNADDPFVARVERLMRSLRRVEATRHGDG